MDDAVTWSAVSPVLASSPQTEIVAEVDVVTAIGVAPSNPSRIYLGYYGGEVFVTDGACPNPGCWPLWSWCRNGVKKTESRCSFRWG